MGIQITNLVTKWIFLGDNFVTTGTDGGLGITGNLQHQNQEFTDATRLS